MINITHMLDRAANEFGDRIAYSDQNKSITYAELKNNAGRIATYLADIKGRNEIKPETALCFYMEKSVDAIIVMFAGMYLNLFYSFIDIRQTSNRAESIISVLEPAFIITDESNEEALRSLSLNEEVSKNIILISDLIRKIDKVCTDELYLYEISKYYYDKMPLYVNFTSGSTGIPKGVVVGHASVIEFINEFTAVFSISDKDVIANQAPFDFDVSVKDIYSGLFTGAKVVLIPREYFSSPAVLMDYLCDNKVTTLIWAVSAMCFVSIMNGLEYKTPDTINKIMFSGELMPVKQLNKWKKYLPDAMYVNLYGPTEITCNCTYHILEREYDKDEVIPAGIPFKNEKVFLLDDNDREVKLPDIEGEICVGGSCLALGYYKDRKKTDEVFIQNPLNNRFNEQIYRTGDLGKYDDKGLLYYTSRKDFQIKHMGQRIELSDIDVSVMSLDGVSRACTIYDMKHKKIILFYTGEADKEAVSKELKLKLPPFMLPSKTVRLDEFPLNKNGKIDRSALEKYDK
ncbi:MAG: AMP-binding protein [Lachnospiraceae bacterium]|nr:AMP-binding protein [Lachnospiraceae bacterium]